MGISGKIRFIIFWAIILPLIPLFLFGQRNNPVGGAPDDKDDPYAPKNRSFALGFHIHAFGLGLDAAHTKMSKRGRNVDRMITVSLESFKDKRESRIPSVYQSQGGRNFIFDKKNYCYVFSFLYGYQKTIVPRTPYSRLSFSVGASVGPAFAFLKPYNVEIAVVIPGTNPPRVEPQTFQYDHNRFTFNDIIGESDFFTGFDKLSVIPGGRLRLHGSLNLSGSNLLVRAIYTGLQLDVFPKPLPIMSKLDNQSIFFGGFLGLMIGNGWKKTK